MKIEWKVVSDFAFVRFLTNLMRLRPAEVTQMGASDFFSMEYHGER